MERFESEYYFYVMAIIMGNEIEFEVVVERWPSLNMVTVKTDDKVVLNLTEKNGKYSMVGHTILKTTEMKDIIDKIHAYRKIHTQE